MTSKIRRFIKLTQFEILISAILMVFLSSCNPTKLSSNFNLSSQAKPSPPEKEAIDVDQQLSLFAEALTKLNQSSTLLNIDQAASTNWNYLGYRTKIFSTEGRGSFSNTLSRTKTKMNFSEVRQEQCPPDMFCIQMLKPYVETLISTQCQKAIYRMSENLVMTSTMTPVSNFQWSIVSGEKISGCENEDASFFTTLGQNVTQNNSLVFVSGPFLFIQTGSMTYIFAK